MTCLNNDGEDPVKYAVNFWGRVKDSGGNPVEGALVILTGQSGSGGDCCLGYTYSNRQGLYAIEIAPGDAKACGGIFRIMACTGHPPSVMMPGARKQSFFTAAGQDFPVLECQVINYHWLRLVASHQGMQLEVEAIPETVKVSVMSDWVSGARVFGVRGRGYITCGEEYGEGTFSLVFCTVGEGMQGQEIIIMKTVPRDRSRKTLFFDTGATLTGPY